MCGGRTIKTGWNVPKWRTEGIGKFQEPEEEILSDVGGVHTGDRQRLALKTLRLLTRFPKT